MIILEFQTQGAGPGVRPRIQALYAGLGFHVRVPG